jgi:CRISPR-associated protein Csb1
MNIDTLIRVVAAEAALRRRQPLQPTGGKGDKIFPPTYPGEGRNSIPRHVYERRRVDGREAWCVLIDSVQSQANRLEECLLEAISDGIQIPHLVVDFSGARLDGISQVTSLDAPHRVYDAILRDSLLDGEPFMRSDLGQRLAKAKPGDASALLEVSPSALLFGAWHSTGEGGGLGAKFARCLTSEIVAVEVPVDEFVANQRTGELEVRTSGRRTGSRIDPLGILRRVEVFKGKSGWGTTEATAGQEAKRVRPSEINHGNIAPSVQSLGVTCDHAEHTIVLSFAALRRLRFGSPDKNASGRALLAALGLLATAEQDARGYALRSRCDLVCDGRAPFEIVHPDGSTDSVPLDRTTARNLYAEAMAGAKKAGFDLAKKAIRLTPQEKLVEIVRKSQELALQDAGGDEEETVEES